MSQFYLTLPSNSSEKYYPDNTLSRFVTKLHNDVSLEGEWEAALVDIMYPRNWYNVEDQRIYVACTNCTRIVPEFSPGETVSTTYEISIGIPSGFYNNPSELVEMITTRIAKAYRKPIRPWSVNGISRYVDESQWPKVVYNKHSRIIHVTMQPDTVVRFSEKLSMMLGFAAIQNTVGTLTWKGERPCDMEGGLHALYVYCDVLNVFRSVIRWLRFCALRCRQRSRGEMTYIQYDQPRYIPLQKKTFDSIEIDIRRRHGRTDSIRTVGS